MTTPVGVQMSRARAWQTTPKAVVVGRPSRWGNPYKVLSDRKVEGPWGDLHYTEPRAAQGVAVRLFREDLVNGRLDFTITDVREHLAGRHLACWCGLGTPCHRNVLLELANPELGLRAPALPVPIVRRGPEPITAGEIAMIFGLPRWEIEHAARAAIGGMA